MTEQEQPDLRVTVRLERASTAPVRVMHPCRCDAPDPEASRMEPLEAPAAQLLAEGQMLLTCPECEYRVLVVAQR